MQDLVDVAVTGAKYVAAADAFMAEAMRLDTMRDVGEKGNLIVMALDQAGADANSIPNVMAALKAYGNAVNAAVEEQDNNRVYIPDPSIEDQGNDEPQAPEM